MGITGGKWRFAASAAIALGLAACGGSGTSSSTTAAQSTAAQTATQAASTASTSAATTASTSAASTSSGPVAPGTKLAVGQTATVAFHPPAASDKSKDVTLKLAVSSMKKGTLNDFNGIKLDANEKAGTPFYVHVHLTNLGPHPVDVDAASAAIEGIDSTGNTAQSVTFIGTFPPCTDNGTTTPLRVGKTFDSCLTYLVPGGISKVAYLGTDSYINSPVTWSP